MSADLEKLFRSLPARYEAGEFEAKTIYYFSLGDDAGAKWTVTLDAKKCVAKQGKPKDDADCVVKTTPEIFRRMVEEGYRPGMGDVLKGKFKTSDANLLGRLGEALGF